MSEHVSRDETTGKGEIVVVDDDPEIRDLLASLFESEGYRVSTFADGESFAAAAANLQERACLLMDLNMPGRSGLEVLKKIDAAHFGAPIIIMSCNATIATAVDAIKSGAFDVVEIPFDPQSIVMRIREIIEAWKLQRESSSHSDKRSMEFPGVERLTQREREVVAEIVAAASNKEAGLHLGLSPRTIEVHRAHIMMKLGTKNTADLVRLVLSRRLAN